MPDLNTSNEDAKDTPSEAAAAAAREGESYQRNLDLPPSYQEALLLNSLMSVSQNRHRSPSVGSGIALSPPVASLGSDTVGDGLRMDQHTTSLPTTTTVLNPTLQNPDVTQTLLSILSSGAAPMPAGNLIGLPPATYPAFANNAFLAPAQIFSAPANSIAPLQGTQGDILRALLQNRALQGIGALPATNALQTTAPSPSALIPQGAASTMATGGGGDPLQSLALAGQTTGARMSLAAPVGGLPPISHDNNSKTTGDTQQAEQDKASNTTTTPLIDQISREYSSFSTKDIRRLPFPEKLMFMLEKEESKGNGHIISFVGEGTAVMIHKTKEFEQNVMPQYFASSKVTSFHRQLNIYDFERVEVGPFKGSYYNKFFKRGQREMLRKIKRVEIKGSRSTSSKLCDDSIKGYRSILL